MADNEDQPPFNGREDRRVADERMKRGPEMHLTPPGMGYRRDPGSRVTATEKDARNIRLRKEKAQPGWGDRHAEFSNAADRRRNITQGRDAAQSITERKHEFRSATEQRRETDPNRAKLDSPRKLRESAGLDSRLRQNDAQQSREVSQRLRPSQTRDRPVRFRGRYDRGDQGRGH